MINIGISPRIYKDEVTSEVRILVDTNWITFLKLQGFRPVILPLGIDVEEYLRDFSITGVILTGGGDLSSISQLENDFLRENFEREIINYCQKKHFPVLGVCRGMQFIAVENGGEIKKIDGHIKTNHKVYDLSGFFETHSFEVNSFHQYTVSLPPGFISLAETGQKQVESFMNHDGSLYGIMWHPERNKKITVEDIVLIKKIFGNSK